MKIFKITAAAAVLVGLLGGAAQAQHAHEVVVPPRNVWSFSGPFGTFDETQLQRGFKVFREVCSNCHSMSRVAFRNLVEAGGPGFSEAQITALAAVCGMPSMVRLTGGKS